MTTKPANAAPTAVRLVGTAPWHIPQEIAERLQVPTSVIQSLVDSGALGASCIGGEWRIAPEALAAYLGSCSNARGRVSHLPRRWLVPAAVLAATASVVGVSALVYAQASDDGDSATIPFQGYLESGGTPVDGIRSLTFCVASSPAGECAWTESHTVEVKAGHFAVALGSSNSVDSLLASGGNLYVGVSVDNVNDAGAPTGEAVQLAGRQLLGSAPFARRGAPGKDFVVDANLGVGTPSPEARLDVVGTAQADYLKVNAQNAATEGGEICLDGAPGYNSWQIDNLAGILRLHHDGSAYLSVTPSGDVAVAGNVHVAGKIDGATMGFGGLYETEDFEGCKYPNPYTNDCTCPPGFGAVGAARIMYPETGHGATLFQCVR